MNRTDHETAAATTFPGVPLGPIAQLAPAPAGLTLVAVFDEQVGYDLTSLVVWVTGFLIGLILVAQLVKKFIQKGKTEDELCHPDHLLEGFRSAYKSGQMDESEYQRIRSVMAQGGEKLEQNSAQPPAKSIDTARPELDEPAPLDPDPLADRSIVERARQSEPPPQR